jgi:phosphopantothenoylcysteine decarboxylase/phosphopantothenate--cysteine ligase
MYKEVLSRFYDSDIVIKAAAVSDYRPSRIVKKKIKKKSKQLILPLIASPDILAEIGRRKKPGQIIVGFALETEDLIANAKKKLKTKNCDMIVANDVSIPGAGFELDTNIVSIIYPDGHVESLPKMKKEQIARQILKRVVRLIRSQ